MPNTVLEKEIATLPHAAISEVVDFIRLIKLKFPEENGVSEKKSLFGIWKNEPFYMSPDFDDPLEDFSEYMFGKRYPPLQRRYK